jgi:hypothetical protein
MPAALRDRLPEPLRVFSRDHVSSFEQLRALLCLARGEGRAWSPKDAALATGLPVELVKGALEELAQAGPLVVASPGSDGTTYAFAPGSATARALVAELARVYDEEPLALIRMMNDNALERVRSTAARRLAEAFRLDREKK